MRMTLSLAGLLLAGSLLFAGCGGGATTEAGQPLSAPKPAPEARGAMATSGDPSTTDLIAGQHHDAGDILIWNDGDNIYVKYTLAEGWTMSEAHLYVGWTPPAKTAPGTFPYKVEGLDGATMYTFEVPLGDFECGDTLIMAAHAVVNNGVAGGVGTQTGWGFGPLGFDKKWGWFMEYTVTPECPIPNDTISFKVAHPYGTLAYFRTNLFGVPPGFVVGDGVDYLGWCVDLFHNIAPGTTYTGNMYSSYDVSLPGDLQDDDWDLVNYLLNNKQGSRDDIQNAIWFFIGGGTFPADPDAQAMIADAQANGEGFVPGPGEVCAVVIDPVNPNVQITIIEVICEC